MYPPVNATTATARAMYSFVWLGCLTEVVRVSRAVAAPADILEARLCVAGV